MLKTLGRVITTITHYIFHTKFGVRLVGGNCGYWHAVSVSYLCGVQIDIKYIDTDGITCWDAPKIFTKANTKEEAISIAKAWKVRVQKPTSDIEWID